jgi:hypothetical protein
MHIPSTAAAPKLAQRTAPKRIRISGGVTVGQLIQKPKPDYPSVAIQGRIQSGGRNANYCDFHGLTVMNDRAVFNFLAKPSNE